MKRHPGRISQGRSPDSRRRLSRRAGVSALDYVLLLGILLPLVAFVMPIGKRMIQLVYEMIVVLITWPFL